VRRVFFLPYLYLKLQTDFAAPWCFRFSANDSSTEQAYPPRTIKKCSCNCATPDFVSNESKNKMKDALRDRKFGLETSRCFADCVKW